MTRTLVDTNILLDIVTNDTAWLDWSVSRLKSAAATGRLAIIDVVYAELSIRFAERTTLDDFLDDFSIDTVATPRDALFLAGKAYRRYLASGGTRTGVLPDFFIGAHAAVAGMPLLTRDPRRYRTYFPTVELIAP